MNRFLLLFKQRYIVLDPDDTSFTFSLRLIKDFQNTNIHFFVFKVNDTFGFMQANEKLIAESQCGELQYNPETKTVGFESLNPTVSYILTTKKLELSATKIRVKKKRTKQIKYYELCF